MNDDEVGGLRERLGQGMGFRQGKGREQGHSRSQGGSNATNATRASAKVDHHKGPPLRAASALASYTTRRELEVENRPPTSMDIPRRHYDGNDDSRMRVGLEGPQARFDAGFRAKLTAQRSLNFGNGMGLAKGRGWGHGGGGGGGHERWKPHWL